jgi:hypothetical protein
MSFIAASIGVSAGTSLIGGLLGSEASNKASEAQVSATNTASRLTNQASNAALAENKRQFDIGQANIQPWITGGTASLRDLLYKMGISTGGGTTQAAAGTTGSDQSGIYSALSSYLMQHPRWTPAEGSTGQTNNFLQKSLAGLMSTIGDKAHDVETRNLFAELEKQGFSEADITNALYSNGQMRSLSDLEGLADQASTTQSNSKLQYGEGETPPGEFGELNKKFEFTQDDPSYQFRLTEGTKALERSGAAKGSSLGGAALKGLTRYAQDYASTEYGNAFNRFETAQTNEYNRYATIAGLGQTSAQQAAQNGSNYANSNSNIVMNNANAQGDYATQAANARASGYMGGANAWSNALSGLSSNLTSALLMKNMFKK